MSSGAVVHAERGGIAAGRDIFDSTITIKRGLDEEETSRLVAGALAPFAENLMALADQVAREKGIPGMPLRAILVKLGHVHVPDHEIPERLNAAADQLLELRRQLSRLSDDRSELAAIRAQALELIDRGEMEAARNTIRRGRDGARDVHREASLREAEFLADEARLDSSELEFHAAAVKCAEAAALAAPFDQPEGWKYLRQQARALREQAARFGDEKPLLEAINIYRRVLADMPHTKLPIDWAATQIDLGNALRSLNKVASIEEAIAACRDALRELSPGHAPAEWINAHTCLGFAFWQLGCMRTSETDKLEEEAIGAFRVALQECTRERDPVQWSMIQLGLGNALAVRSWSDVGMERLEQSAAAFREALNELTRERAPLRWASIQNNLGNVLGGLGERDSGTERLEDAVAACHEALKEYTRECWPLSWAGTQANLGAALLAIGKRERGTARLEEAIAAFRGALERGGTWGAAFVRTSLGCALCALGERESDMARVEEAVANHRQALQECSAEDSITRPLTLTNLADALRLLGERESGTTVRLEAAVAAYQEVIDALPRERDPHLWARNIGGQGIALTQLAERTAKVSMADQGLTQIETALEIFSLGGHAQAVADFTPRLRKAREIRKRL